MQKINKMHTLLSKMYKNSNTTYISLLYKHLYTFNADLQTYKYNNQIFVFHENISPIMTDEEVHLYSDSLTKRFELVKSWDRVERWIIFDFGFKIKSVTDKIERINIFVFFHVVCNAVVMTKNPKITHTDNIDLNDFCNNLTTIEKTTIGMKCLENGNQWTKQYKGEWFEFRLENRTVKCYFPKNKDKISNILTYSRLITITAWDTVYYLVENNKHTYLALSIGWNCIYKEEVFKKLTNLNSSITKEVLTLPTIPKLKPNKYLKLNQEMAEILVVFHAINDVFIINKHDKMESSFLTDTIQKLFNIGITVNMTNVSNYLKIIAPVCFEDQRGRIQLTDEELDQFQQELQMLLKMQFGDLFEKLKI